MLLTDKKFNTLDELKEYALPEGLEKWLLEIHIGWIYEKKLLKVPEDELANFKKYARKLLPNRREREKFYELNEAIILRLKLENGNQLTTEEYTSLCGGKYFQKVIDSVYGEYAFGFGYRVKADISVNHKQYRVRYFIGTDGDFVSAIGYLSMDEIAAAKEQ